MPRTQVTAAAAADTPRFLAVRVGNLVAVRADAGGDWWLGQVIHAEGGARCNANAFFQIACADSGVIRTVNADAVIEILQAGEPAAAEPAEARRRSAALEPAHNHGHQSQRASKSYQEGDRHGQ